MATTLVNIDVADLDRAIRFYRDGLGLRFARKLSAQIAELFAGELAVYLLEKPVGSAPAANAAAPRDYGRHWTPVHLDFVVDDIGAAIAAAVTGGASQEGAMKTHPWGHIAVLSDPFGNGFCLIEFIGRGYDDMR